MLKQFLVTKQLSSVKIYRQNGFFYKTGI